MKTLKKIVIGMAACLLLLAAAFGALYLANPNKDEVPRTAAQDPSIPRIVVNGGVFHVETFGNANNPVLIVVHGGPGWDYRSLLPLKSLADNYFVVFYDQRGTGLSPRVSSKELTLDKTLEDLDAIVDYYSKGKKVGLIGHSWGAMLVSGYLGRHPEKVAKAVLAEPGFLTTELMKESGVRFGPRWEAGFLYRASKAWFEAMHVNGPDQDAGKDYFIGKIAPYANPEYYCGGTVPEAGAQYWRPGVTAMQAIMGSALDEKGDISIDLAKGVENYKHKVLFIASECNRLIGKEHQLKQTKLFPNAELVLIKDSGHMVFGERPSESEKAVRGYLKDAPAF